MEYSWDLFKIRNSYKEIEQILKGNLSIDERNKYLGYKCFYLELMSYFNVTMTDDVSGYNITNIKREIKRVRWDLSKKENELCMELLNYFTKDYKEFDFDFIFEHMPRKESLQLVKEFYMQLDYSIFDEIKDILNPQKRMLYLGDKEYFESICYMDFFKGKPYITIYDEENILTPLKLVHEIGHAYEFKKNMSFDNDLTIMNESLCEVTAIFFELLFFDFLKSKGIKQSQIGFAYLELFDNRLNGLIELKQMLMTKKMGKRSVNKYINSDSFIVDDNFDVAFNLRYLTSLAIALLFYQQYKENKGNALYNLECFIKIDKTDNFDEILEEGKINIYDSEEVIKQYVKKMNALI
ncbi:MAG: hypothetical protein RR161_02115 [Bacilli bacterium]